MKVCSPVKVKLELQVEKPVDVQVGKNHSLILTDQGHVLSFGSSLYHCLGHGSTEIEWIPKKVSLNAERYIIG